MKSTQAIIIGICIIIGLVMHGYITKESFQIAPSGELTIKLNKQTGETFIYAPPSDAIEQMVEEFIWTSMEAEKDE